MDNFHFQQLNVILEDIILSACLPFVLPQRAMCRGLATYGLLHFPQMQLCFRFLAPLTWPAPNHTIVHLPFLFPEMPASSSPYSCCCQGAFNLKPSSSSSSHFLCDHGQSWHYTIFIIFGSGLVPGRISLVCKSDEIPIPKRRQSAYTIATFA